MMRSKKNVAFFNIDLACFNVDLYLKTDILTSMPAALSDCGLLLLVLTNQKLEIKIVTRILTKYIYSSLYHGLGEYSILIGWRV